MRLPQPLDYQNVPRRRIASLLSLAIALTCRFILFNWLFWSLQMWYVGLGGPVFHLIFDGGPFLFTMWWVYRCFCTDEMNVRLVLGFAVRPQALLRVVLADICMVAVIVAFWAIVASLW